MPLRILILCILCMPLQLFSQEAKPIINVVSQGDDIHLQQTAVIRGSVIRVSHSKNKVALKKRQKKVALIKKNQVSYSTTFLVDGRYSRPGNFLMSQLQYSRFFHSKSLKWFLRAGLGFLPVISSRATTKFSGINFSTPLSIGYVYNRLYVSVEYLPYMVARFGLDKQLAKERRSCLELDDFPYPNKCFNADTWILPFEHDHFAFFKMGYTAKNGFGGEIGIGAGRIFGHAALLQKVTMLSTRFQINYSF